MFHFSYRTSVRHGLAVSAFAALGALSACGGDSSDTLVVGPKGLVLNEDNAAGTAQFLLLSSEMVPMMMYLLIGEGVAYAEGPCLNNGSLDTEFDDEDHPLRLAYDNCLVVEDEIEGYQDHIFLDGSVEMEYQHDDSVMPPVLLQARRFTLNGNSTDTNTGETENETVMLDGNVLMKPTSAPLLMSLEDTTATLTLAVETIEDGESYKDGFTWGFVDYEQLATTDGDVLTSMSLNGRVILGQPFGGYVDLKTDVALTYGPDGDCPEAGDLTISGGEGSSLNIAFADSDTVRVTLNGVTDTLSCSEFDEWLSDAPLPFDRALNTVPPSIRAN